MPGHPRQHQQTERIVIEAQLQRPLQGNKQNEHVADQQVEQLCRQQLEWNDEEIVGEEEGDRDKFGGAASAEESASGVVVVKFDDDPEQEIDAQVKGSMGWLHHFTYIINKTNMYNSRKNSNYLATIAAQERK